MPGHEARAVGLEEGEEALEPTRLPQRDVDEVDPAAVVGLVPPLHGDLGRHGLGRVGDEEEVVRGRRRRDEHDHGEERRAGEEERGR